jgi:hypothetical protein
MHELGVRDPHLDRIMLAVLALQNGQNPKR